MFVLEYTTCVMIRPPKSVQKSGFLKSNWRILFVVLTFSQLLPACKPDETARAPKTFTMKGADASLITEIRKSGLVLKNQRGEAEDPLTTLKNAGVNCIRLRLWYDPAEEVSSLESVAMFSEEIKAAGLKTFVTVHYSDTWADPDNQQKPEQWKNLTGAVLADSVYRYTGRISARLKPDFIQIGNEINSGFLWPEGHAANAGFFKQLIDTAASAIRNASPGSLILIHFAGTEGAAGFFESLKGVDFDMIGLSFYPWWHGSVQMLAETARNLKIAHNKPILVAETAYPFTLGWNDWTHNVIGLSSQLSSGYDTTSEGQRAFLALIRAVDEEEKMAGFCYWGGEWVSYRGNESGNGSPWENLAFWNFENTALPVLSVFAAD